MVKEDEYLLTNQEILGGLKAAIERGQNLKQAMMSFYQAGYKKEEIEDAARAYLYLQRGASETQLPARNQPLEPKGEMKKAEEKKVEVKPAESEEKGYSKFEKTQVTVPGAGLGTKKPEEEGKQKVVQKISGYGPEKNPEKIAKLKGKAVTIVLIIVLLALLGILALVFLFRAELVNFINGLFG